MTGCGGGDDDMDGLVEFAPRADELLAGVVGTTHLALASATVPAVATAATLQVGPSVTGTNTVSGPSISYFNDTTGTIQVQVEPSFYDAYLNSSVDMSLHEFYMDQSGAVGGSTTEKIEQFGT